MKPRIALVGGSSGLVALIGHSVEGPEIQARRVEQEKSAAAVHAVSP
jgi:hypothetical protein